MGCSASDTGGDVGTSPGSDLGQADAQGEADTEEWPDADPDTAPAFEGCLHAGGHYAPGEDVPTEVPGQTCWCTVDFIVQCVGGVDPDAEGDEDGEPTEDAGPTGPLVPDPEVTADFSLCSEPGGSFNIYDIQNPDCPDHITPEPESKPGVSVEFEEVVVTGTFGDTFFVQEQTGGPYSGIACYAGTKNFEELDPGDVVTVWGTYYEFYGLSQLTVEDFEVTEVVAPLEAFQIVHPAHIATGGPLSEMFEGVLVAVSDLETIDTKPDCPHEFGEFMVTGDLRIDDMAKELWDPHLGDHFASITGLVQYTFGEFKLEPRTESDLVVIEAGAMTALSKCIEADCIAPETATVTHAVVINEVMVNPYGDDTGQEWFELHNPGAEDIDLNGYTIKDCAEQAMALAGSNLVIEAGEFLVVGAQINPVLNGGVPVDIAYPSPFYLANSVGAVLLYDAAGVLVDQTRYSAFDPWTVLVSGHSLARVSPTADGTQPESWETGQGSFGTNSNHGTPGEPNF